MRNLFPFFLLAALLLAGCDSETPPAKRVTSIQMEDWEGRRARLEGKDSLEAGSTYLSSYSQIYVQSEGRKFSLTGTISLRNINPRDTIYIDLAEYHRTDGAKIRSYFDAPIYLAPLETVEIVITEDDIEGGTGDNFFFNWRKPPGSHDPFFEGVFITVYGQQGISFTTRGIRIE